MISIHNPIVTTYYILFDHSEVLGWGEVRPSQCMDSGVVRIDTYTDKAEFTAALVQLVGEERASE